MVLAQPTRCAILATALVSLAAITLLLAGCAGSPNADAPSLSIRVLASDGCPNQLGDALDVTNPVKYARLVPSVGLPLSGLVCSYTPTDFTLPDSPIPGAFNSDARSEVRLNTTTARAVSVAISRLSLVRRVPPVDCPDNRVGAAAIIVLSYPGRPDIDFWYHDTGCMTLDDGRQTAQASASPYFYSSFASTLELVADVP